MVKKGTILGPRNPFTKTGLPRQLPGRKAPPSEDLRGDRLVMRVHPNLQEILKVRAREKGMSRSAYVESIVIGWAAADPRNPKIDSIGKFDAKAPTPAELQLKTPLRFAERWARFVQISEMILGVPPPRAWFEADPAEYWPDQSEEEAAYDRSLGNVPYEDDQPKPDPKTLNPYRKSDD